MQKLNLGFYTHEKPAQVHFPALRELKLDASGAHGDDGSMIEHLLKASPNLEISDFNYPRCDLDSYKIQNITWDSHFPGLTRFFVSGYDFNPKAFSSLLVRNSSVEILAMDVYAANRDTTPQAFPVTALLNLRAVCQPNQKNVIMLEDLLNLEAGRPIRNLALVAMGFGNYRTITKGKGTLKCVDIGAMVTRWRPKEPDSNDEREGNDEVRCGGLPEAVKRLLPCLSGLKELGVSLRRRIFRCHC
ncbi:hypothetical protein K469DRAFT_766138 [Zopfia rhizophila CBS 207.26]|uniref:F-box domain-containing protein n=1 Tax=Zopfia rhizophila CBS 207.26 TaxID=1314779 RepID=A0A6A6ED17_9PEZI|nr:hypothetical protein K469DRAFT_766138 [Zopfia rhizophila CBS 207.26]